MGARPLRRAVERYIEDPAERGNPPRRHPLKTKVEALPTRSARNLVFHVIGEFDPHAALPAAVPAEAAATGACRPRPAFAAAACAAARARPAGVRARLVVLFREEGTSLQSWRMEATAPPVNAIPSTAAPASRAAEQAAVFEPIGIEKAAR